MMWTEIPGLLLKFWREVLILSLVIALSLSTLHGRALTAEKELAENNLREYIGLANAAAKAAKAESGQIAKEINK